MSTGKPDHDETVTAAGAGGIDPSVQMVPRRWPDRCDELPAPWWERHQRGLVAIIGVIAAAALVMWWLVGGEPSTESVIVVPRDPGPAHSPGPAPPELTSEVLVPTVKDPVPTGQPATGTAAHVAAGFAADYGNPGTGKEDWCNRVSRWTAPQLTEGYRLTDPNRLPAAQFQGLSAALNNDSATVVFDAVYNSMTLEIRVAFIGDRWQVVAALDTRPPVDTGADGPVPHTPPYIPPDIGSHTP